MHLVRIDFLKSSASWRKAPTISVPSIVLRGVDSGFGRPTDEPSGDQAKFSNLVARRNVEGAGHDLPVQRPDAVAAALLDLL